MTPVSLEEMMKYVDNISDLKKLDSHFRRLTMAGCYLCSYPYQFIIKLENLNEELSFVLRKILGHDNFNHPQTPPDKQSNEALMAFLKQVPSELSFKLFSTVYHDDFDAFGYNLQETLNYAIG